MRKNTKGAFRWIVGLLRDSDVLFQISGGLAARCYGSRRPLFDIDIDVKCKNFNKLLPAVRRYVTFGPKRYHDESFDLVLLTLEYKCARIDLASSVGAKMYNQHTRRWETCGVNYKKFTEKEIYGLLVPVVRRQELITYKKIIGRSVDLQDILSMKPNKG